MSILPPLLDLPFNMPPPPPPLISPVLRRENANIGIEDEEDATASIATLSEDDPRSVCSTDSDESDVSTHFLEEMDSDVVSHLVHAYGGVCCNQCGYRYVYECGAPWSEEYGKGWWDASQNRLVRIPCSACNPRFQEQLLQYLEKADEDAWDRYYRRLEDEARYDRDNDWGWGI